MRNGQLAAAQAVLKKQGIAVPDGTIMDMIAAIENSPPVIYEPGDFVWIYEGMGEGSYGMVKRRKGDGYVIEGFDYEGLWPSYKRERTVREIGNLSTPEDAMEEHRLRGGISEAEYNKRFQR